jgi:hypothetical protein
MATTQTEESIIYYDANEIDINNETKKYDTSKPVGKKIDSIDRHTLKKVKISRLVKMKKDGELIIPEFQRDLILSKVRSIENYYMLNQNIFNYISNPIQIANYENKLFLIDGQHRLEALLNLTSRMSIDDHELFVNIFLCDNIQSMKELYCNINLDRLQINEFNENNIQSEIIKDRYLRFKKLLREKFNQTFYNDPNIYSLDNFIKQLRDINYLERYNDLNEAYQNIKDLNDKCSTYYTNAMMNKLKLTGKQKKLINNKIILSIINSNFINVLDDSNINYKYIRNI